MSISYKDATRQGSRSNRLLFWWFFDDAELFENYNKDYKDLTDKDLVQLIIEFDEKCVEQVNRAIVNYLSNVGGKIDIEVNRK